MTTTTDSGAACVRCGGAGFRTLAAEMLCQNHFVGATRHLGRNIEPDPDAADTPTGYRYTDAGNARLLVDLHGHELRHVSAWGTWLAWDGRRWVTDHGDARTIEYAKDLARHMLRYVTDVTGAQREALVKWANRSEMRPGMVAAAALAATHPSVRVDHRKLDADPMLLNLANGTFDLVLRKLVAHDPTHLITKVAEVEYQPDARCPQWVAFLERVIPDSEVRGFVQRAVGYCLTARTDAQVMFFLIGNGANGKSVFLNVLRRLLGEYAVVAPRDLLVAQRHDPHPTSTAVLFGSRVATASEVEAGARLAEAKVKELTGSDDLTARRMREDFWTFTPTHKLWLAANHRPVVSGADEGIWRRIRVVPFEVTIPPHERDPGLLDRLLRELPGILRWALDGWAAYADEGGLGLPDAIDFATAEYRAEQDVVGQFLDANGYRHQAGAYVPAGDLRRQYEAWCDAEGLHAMHPTAFANALRSRGLRDSRKHRGRVWEGIGATSSTIAATAPYDTQW